MQRTVSFYYFKNLFIYFKNVFKKQLILCILKNVVKQIASKGGKNLPWMSSIGQNEIITLKFLKFYKLSTHLR